MESKKTALMNLFLGQQWRNRGREQTYGHRGGEEWEGEVYGENKMEIYNTICKIDSQWESAVWLGELKQGLCDRLKGGMGREMGGRLRREGTCVYQWLVLVDVRQKNHKIQ